MPVGSGGVNRSVEFSFEVLGEKQVSRRIERFRLKGQHLKPAFENIHKSFLAIEQKQFATEGKSGSGGWVPVSAARKRYKAAHGLSPKTMQATQRLRKSFANKSHADHVFKATKDSISMGSNVFYGVFHQSNAPRKISATKRAQGPSIRRPLIDLTEAQRRSWMRIIQKFLVENGGRQ